MKEFIADIAKFHDMYRLPKPAYPRANHLPIPERMADFKRILLEEVSEVDAIVENAGINHMIDLSNLADWLGDIIVYAASEMMRYGIPIDKTLAIIMESNFSKLDEDGNPIYVGGKVEKGPDYWPPEPKLYDMLTLEVLRSL